MPKDLCNDFVRYSMEGLDSYVNDKSGIEIELKEKYLVATATTFFCISILAVM